MLSRLPKPQAILQVYAVIAVLFSAWTITAFLWKLSAWLLLLNLGELFTIFSYAMLTNLLESLIILLICLGICVVLPPDLFRDDFVVRGAIMAVGLIGSLMAFVGLLMQFGIKAGNSLLAGPIAVLLLTLLLLRWPLRSRFTHYVRSTVLWVTDRMVVFLFILLPLYAALSVYVVFRNIL